jgi:hypothetical protein
LVRDHFQISDRQAGSLRFLTDLSTSAIPSHPG